MGQQWPATEMGALGAADLGMAKALLVESARKPTIEPPELYAGLDRQTLGGHKQNLVPIRTQEKGVVAPQETNPDLPERVEEPLVEA